MPGFVKAVNGISPVEKKQKTMLPMPNLYFGLKKLKKMLVRGQLKLGCGL